MKLLVASAVVAAPAYANETHANMAVSLVVNDGCAVSSSPMHFSASAGTASDARAQASVTLNCAPLTTYEIAIDGGENPAGTQRRMVSAKTGELVAYDVYRDPALASRWGNQAGLDTVGGQVLSAGPVVHVAYGKLTGVAAPIAPGTHSDTLVVTVNF